MHVILSRWVMLVMVLIGVPGYPAERLAPYDGFNATHIARTSGSGENTVRPSPVRAPRRSGRSRTTGCAWCTAAMAPRTPTAAGCAANSC
jgi:hypothetical protein